MIKRHSSTIGTRNARNDAMLSPATEEVKAKPPPTQRVRPRLVNGPNLAAQAPKQVATAEERAFVTNALGAIKTADDVRALTPNLRDLASHMATADLGEVLGDSPAEMLSKFQVSSDPITGRKNLSQTDRNRMAGAWALSKTLLEELADHTLLPITTGDASSLDYKGLSDERREAILAQHAGYVADVISRDPKLQPPIDIEAARAVLSTYFAGELKATREPGAKPSREVLADLLSTLGGGDAIRELVLPKKEGGGYDMFSIEQALSPASVMSNLASVHAVEATQELAAQLVGEKHAAAFIKHVFERPTADLIDMLQVPRGPEGILLHFAVTANNLGWEWAKLGTACLEAQQGTPEADRRALADAQHDDFGPTSEKIARDPNAASKMTTQVESYFINLDMLVPRGQSGGVENLELQDLLDEIARNGSYSDPRLPIPSPFARSVCTRLARDVRKAAKLPDWKVSGHLAANTVSQTCSAFACHAIGADFSEKDAITTAFRKSLIKMRREADHMLNDGGPKKTDEDYQALYRNRGGEVSFRALHDCLGEASRAVVRNGTFADLIAQALKNLRLDDSAEYTAKNLVEDLKELKGTLLADDYFLKLPGFIDELEKEAARGKSDTDPRGLELAVRFPNAQWMWLMLIRDQVEEKTRLDGAQVADLKSDKFPDGVQFNPPDLRDAELFKWAFHRLTVGDHMKAERATRMALSLVVFTLYKDLLQVRKGAAM